MDHHQLSHAELEQRPGRMSQCHGVQLAVVLPNLEAGRLACLDFVQHAVVGVLQRRGNDIRETIAVLAHGIDAGLEAGRLRRCQQLGCLGTKFLICPIKSLHQKQIAEVEKTGLGFRKIKVATVPYGVGSLIVKKRAVAALEFRHDIRVGGRRIGGGSEELGVDLEFFTVVLNQLAKGILADQPGRGKWHVGPELGHVHQQIVGRTAGSRHGRAVDVGKLLPLRVDIDHFDLINDPVSTGENP